MATLNPSILLAQQQYKPPNLDFSETFVNMAKMKAYDQARRLEELKYGQLERTQARDEEFDRLAAGLFTPEQPAAAPPQRGLAFGVSAAPGGPPPPSPAGPSMAGLTAPAAPGTNYAMARPDITQMPDPVQAGYQRAPGAMQSLATATAPFPGSTPPQESVAMNILRGLAEAPVGAPTPTPPEPPAGLGGAQPGAPKSLLQPINEQVLMRLYAANPEKASRLMEGHLKMQEQKLNTSEKINEQVYQVLSALQASPNPAAMYPRALEALRERGIPIPASFPREYDAGLIAFKMREHETLKDQLEKAKILHEDQKTRTARADELYKGAQAKREGTQAELDVATTGLRKEETTKLVDERQQKLTQVTPYTSDSTKNVYLSQAAQDLGLPPGAPPTAAVIERARQYEVADQQAVVRQHGVDAAKKVLPEADARRVQAFTDKGTAMEGLQNTLDEVERLIGEGVYTNIPEERIKQILADAGLRATDAKAARTARLYELGHALAIENAGGKLGGQVSDTDLKAIQAAGGNFQSAKGELAMQESIKSMRTLAKIHLQDANKGWKQYKETQTLPAFGALREERLKILTPERLAELKAARPGWTDAQLKAYMAQQGWREE